MGQSFIDGELENTFTADNFKEALKKMRESDSDLLEKLLHKKSLVNVIAKLPVLNEIIKVNELEYEIITVKENGTFTAKLREPKALKERE